MHQKTSSKVARLGWIAFAILGVTLFTSGFQGASDKTAVVDLTRAIEASNFGKQSEATFAAMKAQREELLSFIDTNRVLTNEQAQKLRELWVKPNLTEPEKLELDRLKADIVAAAKRSQELAGKPNISAEERTLLEDYARRSATMDQVANRWYRDFLEEMQDWSSKQKQLSFDRARQALNGVAKAQGYTLVFESGIAPFGANDLTEATIQALNAQS